jgi:hypothetical protein
MADHNAYVICGAPDPRKHALIDCNFARFVWAFKHEEIVESICTVGNTGAKGWLMEVFSILPHNDLIWVVVTMWAIWYARRKVMYENSF